MITLLGDFLLIAIPLVLTIYFAYKASNKNPNRAPSSSRVYRAWRVLKNEVREDTFQFQIVQHLEYGIIATSGQFKFWRDGYWVDKEHWPVDFSADFNTQVDDMEKLADKIKKENIIDQIAGTYQTPK